MAINFLKVRDTVIDQRQQGLRPRGAVLSLMRTSGQIWFTLVAADIGLLLLLAWSFLYIEKGTASYIVAQLSAIILFVTLAGLSTVIYVGWEPF